MSLMVRTGNIEMNAKAETEEAVYLWHELEIQNTEMKAKAEMEEAVPSSAIQENKDKSKS